MAEAEVKGLADTLMWVVGETFGQLPGLSNDPDPSSRYLADSLAAAEARAVGPEAVEEAIEQGWYAIYILGELQFSLGYLLLIDDALSVSPWTLVRSHLEIASRAAWVLDPLVSSPTERIERSIALQLDELQRSRGFVDHVAHFLEKPGVVGREGAQADLASMWSYLEGRASALGIKVKPVGKQPRRISRVGTTQVLQPSQMASRALDQGADYRFLSAMSHYRPITVFSLDERRNSLLEFSRKVLQWFAIPSWYLFELCGFDLAVLRQTFGEAWDRSELAEDTRFWEQPRQPQG